MSILSDVIEGLNQGAIAIIDDGERLLCNEIAIDILGEEPESLGELVTLLADRDDHVEEEIQSALTKAKEETAGRLELDLGGPVGLQIALGRLAAGSPDLVLLLSDRKQVEEEKARQARLERLASVGQLTAGVTHELNNVLTAILGWTQIALRDTRRTERVESALSIIDESSRRAKSIISDILTIARGEATGSPTVPMTEIADEVLRVLSWDINNSGIEIFRNYRDRSEVRVERRKLFQVFLNIVLNAIQAMRSGGGEITVTTSKVDGEAQIEFRDSGHGMDSATLDKIFEPHFTTKNDSLEGSRGTGLGLAISRLILADIGGEISARSEPDAGATFTVRLPAALHKPSGSGDRDSDPAIVGFGFRLLVVENEKPIRDMIKESLSRDEVVMTSTGIEALAFCRRQKFDLALLDYSMPGISGKALATQIRDLCPDVRIVVMSGRAEDLTLAESGGDVALKKPFELRELDAALRKIVINAD